MCFEGRAQLVQCTVLPDLSFVRDETMLQGFLSPTIVYLPTLTHYARAPHLRTKIIDLTHRGQFFHA